MHDLVHLWNRITTFNEEISDAQVLTKLANKVSAAERIVFLGCHFHEQNMKLLRAALPAKGSEVSVYATGIQRSQSALQEIESQIREMLGPRGGTWRVQNYSGSSKLRGPGVDYSIDCAFRRKGWAD
jgi:hypothetical protein